MAYQIPNLSFTLPLADPDGGDVDFRFGAVDSDGRVAVTGAGEGADVVIQQPAEYEEDAETTCFAGSVTKIRAGGTVATGDLVTSDGEGRAVTAGTAGQSVNGRCLEGGASGELITVLQLQGGVVPA